MPKSFAKAASPPAAAISSDVSPGVMAGHIKHSVYSKSNTACNNKLNNAFNIHRMAKTKAPPPNTNSIKIALKIARDKHKWNQSDFARELALASGKPIRPQDVTNWKKRGMPAEHLEAASRVLQCSVDELLGRTASGRQGTTEPWTLNFPRALYDQLDKDERVIFGYESRKKIAEIISQRSDSGKQGSDR